MSVGVLCLTVIMCVCYGIYLSAGLQLLLLSYAQDKSEHAFPMVSWSTSVTLLVIGNILNGILLCGPRILLLFVRSLFVVFVAEEFGLCYGVVFGKYEFTDSLGERVTGRLPYIVLMLWQCFLYPSIILSYILLSRQQRVVDYITYELVVLYKRHKNPLILAVVAAGIVVMFDVVSEPIGVLYGHKVIIYGQ